MEELIYKYFPELTPEQKQQISMLLPLYREWNQKINLISRKDIENLYLHHVLHSLAIAKRCSFPDNSYILDVGTGGGFPGIPLAIMFPKCRFHLCDSIGKKITVVAEVASALSLKNVTAQKVRAEEIDDDFDFVVSRAVTDLSQFLPWVWKKIRVGKIGKQERGVLYLKGGSVNDEMVAAARRLNLKMDSFSKTEISNWFDEPWFEEKSVIFVKR
ncbi:MAG: 16S rRNA (guanine(527)-N(7))-methyltransferase RsmG [Bacteroidales bacterium]